MSGHHFRLAGLFLVLWPSPNLLGQDDAELLSGKELDQSVITWRGCGISKHAFMHACADTYQRKYGVQFKISGGGATLGIDAAGSGGADLGGTCRHCLASKGEWRNGLKLAVVAWDALAVATHPSTLVDNLTHKQVRDILTQRVRNWSDVGGGSGRIVVVARRGKTSGVGFCTRQLILGDPETDFGKTVIRLNSSGPVEKLVERQPFAIAITGVSSARKRDLKVLSIDGQQPTRENIATGSYPFFRPLYLAYRPSSSKTVDHFVSWLISDEGQRVVESQGTVSLKQGAALTGLFAHFPAGEKVVNFDALKGLLEPAQLQTPSPSK